MAVIGDIAGCRRLWTTLSVYGIISLKADLEFKIDPLYMS